MRERLYTFGLDYGGDIEELDVRASCRREARARARQLAQADYMPGWDRIIELPAGGSGGLLSW